MQKREQLKLYCEYLEKPVGIDAECPRFSWVYQTEDRGLRQEKYQIIVAEDEDGIADGNRLLWDSGVVDSDQTLNVSYAGTKLRSACTYFYRVTIWLNNGEKIESGTSEFLTGLMDDEPWRADWVGGPMMEKHTFWFRKEFELHGRIRKAVAFVASPCYYVLTVNGEKIGDAVLNNAWTDSEKTCLYATYLVTKNLIQAQNAIGVTVGNGWNALRLGEDGAGKGEHLFSMQMLLEYEDGRGEWLCSDLNGWYYTADGPIVFNSIYHGETYDARREIIGWDQSGYDIEKSSAHWSKVVEFEPMHGKMQAQELEPCKVVQHFEPVKIYEIADGSYGIDFGQNYAGWVKLSIHEKCGTEIVAKYAELEHQDHTVNQVSLRGVRATDTYIAKGDETEIYEPSFTYHGFRFVQVYGLSKKPEAGDVVGCVVRSAVDIVGSFHCDNPLLNRLYQNIMWTEGSNLHGLPTDCPQRDERLGWLNDMTVRNECALYNYRLPLLYEKWLQDIRDTQGEKTGAITDTAPFTRFGQRPADPVSSSFLLIPWNVYCHYQDKKVLEDNYEAAQKWVNYLKRNSDNYIVRYCPMGDWAAPIDGTDKGSIGAGAVSTITPTVLMGTGYLYYDFCLLAKMARVLGKHSDEEYYQNEAANVKEAFQREFYHEDKGYYASNSQASNTFPLYLGMGEEGNSKAVISHLVHDIVETHKNHLTTGNLCSRYMIEVLFQNGEENIAYDLLTQDSYPSWGYMIANGATTVWERWENITEEGPLSGMASHNHPMNGAVGVCFHKYLAGISVDESNPGFKNIKISPVIPHQMRHVEASIQTMRGIVSSSWHIGEDDTFSLEVMIPFNCTGEIHIPLAGTDAEAVTLLESGGEIIKNGRVVSQKGFGSVVCAEKEVIVKVASGSYQFVRPCKK